MSFEQELTFARSVAQEAGELALRYQQQKVTAESKSDQSPVTIADRECEALIVRRIAETFPDDGVLGEEGAQKEASNGRLWIIDPIDGTRDFVRGNPFWSVLIALEVNGKVTTGVSHLAGLGKTFYATAGHGAYCATAGGASVKDERLQISAIDRISQAVICVNGVQNMREQPFAPRLLDWISDFWAVRSLGGCMDAMMLASGQVDAWLEPQAKPWDLASLQVILEEAGAVFFNLDGGRSIYGGDCAACVPALEPDMRRLLGLETPLTRAAR